MDKHNRQQIKAAADSTRMLLVEDNEDDIFLTRRAFSSAAPGVTIEAVSWGQEAITWAGREDFDIAVVDYQLPDVSGMDVLASLAALDVPVIMVTGRGDERVAVQALKSGAVDYLVKDDGYLRRLPQAVIGAVTRSRLARENQRLLADRAQQASLLEAVLDNDPGAIAVLRGPKLQFELVNPTFRSLWSGFDSVAIGKSILEIVPDDVAPRVRQGILEAYALGKDFSLRDETIVIGGKARHFHVHIVPLDSGNEGDERGIAVILWEVTEEVVARQRVEELALQADAQRLWLQTVIDQMPEGVHIVSAPGAQILLVNRAASELLGEPAHDNFSHSSVPLEYGLTNTDGTQIPVEELPLQRALWREETVVGQELRHTRGDKEVDLLVNAAPLYNNEGKLIAAAAVFQDITRLKDVDRLKDEFMSIASHELRTPLTNMKAAAQLMLRRIKHGDYPRQEVSLINTIVQQSERMTRLIEELLDVSRLQSGQFQIHPEPLELTLLAHEVVGNARMAHPQFTMECLEPGPVWVNADRDRLAQVLSNLLDNAVKYNQKQDGHIAMRISSDTQRGNVRIEVEDDGIGFNPSQSEAIFERFSRLGSVAHHSKGMGLGLFICRQIMLSHGGTITAYSAGPNEGSTFTLTLPLAEFSE